MFMEVTGRTILIVDDNADDRFFMSKALERVAPGIIAQYAYSGEEAIAYLKGHGNYGDRVHFPYPSFVVTDIEMAHGDGFSVLQELQRTSLANVLPVMMLSSSRNPDDIRRAYSLGATSYCLKPRDGAALCTILNAFFNGYVSGETPAGETDGKLLCL
jgi:CheY-like chemotaxis protein